MERRSNYAAGKDAQIKSDGEECVLGMEQWSNYAAVKDVLIMLSKEECAGRGSIVQRSNYAAAKDARIKLSKEEYVLGTGPIACEDS